MGKKWGIKTKKRLGKPKLLFVVNIDLVIDYFLIVVIQLEDSIRQALPKYTMLHKPVDFR